MKNFVTTAAVLGALSAGVFASPASARVTESHDMTTACWLQVHHIVPGYGSDAGADRKREFMLDVCLRNGGRMP